MTKFLLLADCVYLIPGVSLVPSFDPLLKICSVLFSSSGV